MSDRLSGGRSIGRSMAGSDSPDGSQTSATGKVCFEQFTGSRAGWGQYDAIGIVTERSGTTGLEDPPPIEASSDAKRSAGSNSTQSAAVELGPFRLCRRREFCHLIPPPVTLLGFQ